MLQNNMDEIINIVIGYDEREAIAFHTCVQSIISNTSCHVNIIPLCLKNFVKYRENHKDGSNEFIYSRFLAPYLMNFKGWVLFLDGDMVCKSDLKELWDQRNEKYAVQVVKHDYKTRMSKKYFGNVNENYPRKNWSSVIVWNCSHPKNRQLDPLFVSDKDGAFLHRFNWLDDEEIGDLPKSWNWLAIEYPEKENLNLIHYTLGTPCFKEYSETSLSKHWKIYYKNLLEGLSK